MNTDDITRAHIYGAAQRYGFQRDTTEKVVRLYYVLKAMSENPLFRDNLALKGGTAINLAYFDLCRLSVDIDMDCTRSDKMEDLLSLRKAIKDTLFEMLQSQGYSIGKEGKETHTLDQWTFAYTSIGGNNDHIKIELNYGIRNHVLPIVDKEVKLGIVSDSGISVPTLHPCELFATKINALLERATVRDLFDVYTLAGSGLLASPEETALLRKCIVFYQTVGVEGSARKEVSTDKVMEVPSSRIKSQLVPLLASGNKYFPIDDAKKVVLEYLSSILQLLPEEMEYMDAFANNIYQPELLFRESAIVERIAEHPMALWKIRQGEKQEGVQ